MKDAVRSIERGLGPSKLKDSFDLTLLRTIWDSPSFQEVEDDYIMVLSGSWFLMREIEVANAKASHVRFEHTSSDSPVVHWSLPVSKTDTKGEMIERSHVCSCSAAIEPLCIVHALKRRLDKIELMTDRTPLFPDGRGHTRSKADTIKAIRNIIHMTGTETTRIGLNGRSLERFGRGSSVPGRTRSRHEHHPPPGPLELPCHSTRHSGGISPPAMSAMGRAGPKRSTTLVRARHRHR